MALTTGPLVFGSPQRAQVSGVVLHARTSDLGLDGLPHAHRLDAPRGRGLWLAWVPGVGCGGLPFFVFFCGARLGEWMGLYGGAFELVVGCGLWILSGGPRLE